MNKLIISAVLLLCVTSACLAQENPFRIGLKLGIPNIAGLNAEVVTPLKKLSATGDFSWFGLSFGDSRFRLRYLEIGGNYYFSDVATGLYGHLSYGNLNAGLDFNNVQSENDPSKYGSASADVGVSLYNLKVGAKLGYSIYFRAELGFAFASVDKTVDVVVTYPDGTTEDHSQNVPGLIGGGPLINLGFGIAF